MDNTVYLALSRQMTLRHEMDVIANNVANSSTIGFKVENVIISEESRNIGGKMVSFATDSGVARNFAQGSSQTTGAPFDLAINGPGFFRVNTPDGERYTRDGHFQMNEAGILVTQSGEPVADAGGGEITIDPKKGAVKIAKDGTISQGTEIIGKISVFNFTALSALEKTGNNQFRNTGNQQPAVVTSSGIFQGNLESSNVNAIDQISRMVEVTRAYEAISKLTDNSTDLSRRAVERLGRVQ